MAESGIENKAPELVRLPTINPAMFNEARGMVEVAESIEIDGPEMYEIASGQLKEVKAMSKRLEEQRKSITKPLDEAKKAVMDTFRPAMEFCDQAEGMIKRGMLGYDNEQRRIRQEEERKAREAAEAERKRIQENARKKAEAEAAEARKLAEAEAEAARKKAADEAAKLKAAGDDKAAEAARQKAEQEAEAKAKQAEEAAAAKAKEAERQAQAEAEQVAVHAPVEQPQKLSGVSYRETWKAEVEDIDAVIKAAAEGNQLARALLTVNTTTLGQQARSLKNNLQVPGIRAYSERTVASRT